MYGLQGWFYKLAGGHYVDAQRFFDARNPDHVVRAQEARRQWLEDQPEGDNLFVRFVHGIATRPNELWTESSTK